MVNSHKLSQDITFVLQLFSSFIICVGLFCAFAYNIDIYLNSGEKKFEKYSFGTSKTPIPKKTDDSGDEFEPVDGQSTKVPDDDTFVLQNDSSDKI